MNMRLATGVITLATFACLLMAAPRDVTADDAGREAQNPLASLISIQFENFLNFGLGPFDREQEILNFQAVVPFELGGGWGLVTRTVVPTFIPQPIITTPGENVYGLGDINPEFFFVAPPQGILTWGAGPQFTLPTATKTETGADKWQGGPIGVFVLTPGNIVMGTLAFQSWSFADAPGGSNRPEVNRMTVKPFFNYNFEKYPGWFFFSKPIITVDWNAPSGDRWNVPLGGGLGKSFKIGEQNMQLLVGGYSNVIRPNDGADWQAFLNLSFLFPQ
jgi:hypothetical protein